MSKENSPFKILLELEVGGATPVSGSDGLLQTRLTHPALKGELLLVHMSEIDRDALIRGIAKSPLEADPIGRALEMVSGLIK